MPGTLHASRSRAGLLVAAIVGCGWLAGCAVLPVGPTATAPPPNGNEGAPGPSYVHITGEPAVADDRLVFGYVLPDGAASSVTDVVEAGEKIEIDRTSQPGRHQLLVNGAMCANPYTLVVGQTVSIVVHIDRSGCRVEAGVAGGGEDASPAPT